MESDFIEDLAVFQVAIQGSFCTLLNVQDNDIGIEKREAIIALLDDRNPIVRKELLKEFYRMGDGAISFLKELSNGKNRINSWFARWYLTELRNSNPISEFREFIRSQSYELESGCLMISRVAYPDLDIGQFCHDLDEIADRCRELILTPSNPRDRCVVINRVLFHEMGFRGNSENYEDPENSFINRVLSRKIGLPITLSALYILIGRRLGVDLEGIGLSGHFIVGCFEQEEPFYVDPFERGRIWSAKQLFEKLEIAHLNPSLNQLAPVPIREMLCRQCRNLVGHYNKAGSLHMAAIFKSFVEEFEETYHKHVKR